MFKAYQKDIVDLVPEGSRVLDLGCGEGNLLYTLKKFKNIQAVGVDICQDNVTRSVVKGIATIQGDIDVGLAFYADQSFNVVILSQTLQVVRRPIDVLKEMVRVGQTAIVSVPNFGHWPLRVQIFFKGHMPKNKTLGYEWYDTPNIHLASMKDVQDVFAMNQIKVLERRLYASSGRKLRCGWRGNLFAETALFVIQR